MLVIGGCEIFYIIYIHRSERLLFHTLGIPPLIVQPTICDNVAERLRRWTRNPLGSPAQVRILPLSSDDNLPIFLPFSKGFIFVWKGV